MIRVLIVDDSAVAQQVLRHRLSSDPDIQVVGVATDGVEALSAAVQYHPDVITMDIHMPRMGGIEATRRLMESHPVPIVVVTGSDGADEVGAGIQALAAGALAVVFRSAADLVQTVKLMSEIRVVRRHSPQPAPPAAIPAAPIAAKIVAVGASTGGPAALARLLGALPAGLAVPVLVVQHIAAGFLPGLIDWLAKTTPLSLCIASAGVQTQPGRVYFAPDGQHLGVDGQGCIVLSDAAPDQGLRPSVAHLFRSVRRSFGAEAAAVLLTGMGRDGADELRELRDEGGLTLAQDEESSVVHGMPGAAILLGAATYVLPPERIAAVLAAGAHP